MNSKDKKKYKIAYDEIKRLRELIKGHKKLLEAIGNL